MTKTFTITESGKFMYAVLGSRYGLTIEVKANSDDFLFTPSIKQKLPIMYKSQLLKEDWDAKAEELGKLLELEA